MLSLFHKSAVEACLCMYNSWKHNKTGLELSLRTSGKICHAV
ncbi:hypothetical protein CLOSTHATH_00425 [Hungatella hathewayi DSM 13479]|uniref:Uncharacterized protein n=1 Tax=Hungatella hathewayi DSM 13479 TaxID=566550 RepID=D3AA04_9FIRM|nr:hypothetical protein CLOSTHATH_00425 [Hungatella hathewayi DSM 13479]